MSYSSRDSRKYFTIEQDITTDVLVYYELPQVNLNRKDFIESKDSRCYTTLFNKVVCGRADSRDWVKRWRGSDSDFLKRIDAVPGDDIVPCGSVALSMFTDEYAFFEVNGPDHSTWPKLQVDESLIALPGDEQAFTQKIIESGSTLTIAGLTSWIPPGHFFEHWKVWYRTPAAPHVRNLWAVIKGGLHRGDYAVDLVVNSPVWEEWGVPEKRIIVAQQDPYGNSGALRFLGGICIAAGLFELLVFGAFAWSYCFVKPGLKMKAYQVEEIEYPMEDFFPSQTQLQSVRELDRPRNSNGVSSTNFGKCLDVFFLAGSVH